MSEQARATSGAQLLSAADAQAMSQDEANRLYQQHVSPSLYRIYRMLGTSGFDVERAQGVELTLTTGETVYDFSCAMGILGLGSNHPRILEVERRYNEESRLEPIKLSPSKLQAALAYNLAQLLPAPLSVSFFAVSGAEAVEAAMKLAERAQPGRSKYITTRGSYHGRTHATLPLTRAPGFEDGFLRALPKENIVEVDYGDAEAMKQALAQHGKDVIAIILEPIQGQGARVPPEGYLKDSAQAAREQDALVIFDEIKVGMGRTGRFCCFEHEGVVPDVLTLSKSLGGGKRAISAMITSESVFKRAYGTRQGAGLHGTTFGGMGSACAIAIEALNVLVDEGLIQRASVLGDYLRRRLEELQRKYPKQIKEVRGRGLFQAVEFNLDETALGKLVDLVQPGRMKTARALLIASIVREMYTKHRILCHFTAAEPSTLHALPPLVAEERHLDAYADALDQILSEGLMTVLARFIKGNLQDLF